MCIAADCRRRKQSQKLFRTNWMEELHQLNRVTCIAGDRRMRTQYQKLFRTNEMGDFPGLQDEEEVDYGEDDPDDDTPKPWSIQTRVREHRAAARQRDAAERQKKESSASLLAGDGSGAEKPKGRRTGFDPLPADGSRVFQKNEGEWEFYLGDSEDGAAVVRAPRHPTRAIPPAPSHRDVPPRHPTCAIPHAPSLRAIPPRYPTELHTYRRRQ